MLEREGENLIASVDKESPSLCSLDLEPHPKESKFRNVMHKLHDFFLGEDHPPVSKVNSDGSEPELSAKEAKSAAKSLGYLNKNVKILEQEMAPAGSLSFNLGYVRSSGIYIASASRGEQQSSLASPRAASQVEALFNERLPVIEKAVSKELNSGIPTEQKEQLKKNLDDLKAHHDSFSQLITQQGNKENLTNIAKELIALDEGLQQAKKLQKRVAKEISD